MEDMRHEVIDERSRRHIPENAYAEQWDTRPARGVLRLFGSRPARSRTGRRKKASPKRDPRARPPRVDGKMAEKAANYGPEVMRVAEKTLLLQILDQAWKDICCRSTTCATASACAPMRSATR